MTDLIQIIYASQPFGYDEPTLAGILLDARRFNKPNDITGALICRHDIYLQLLEGPETKVRETYQRILRDDRHAGVNELVSTPITSRMFGEWEMLHDPAKSWIWSEADLSAGVLDHATPAEITKVFQALADKV